MGGKGGIEQTLARFVAYFTGDDDVSDDLARRMRLFLVLHIGLMTTGVLFALLAPIGNSALTRPVLLGASFVAGANPFLYRVRKNMDECATVMSTITLVALGSIAFEVNGIKNAALWWNVTAPLLCMFLSGPKLGFTFCGLVVVEHTALWLKDLNLPDPGADRFFEWAASSLVVVFLTAMSYFFERERARAMEVANARLDEVKAIQQNLKDANASLERRRTASESLAGRKSAVVEQLRQHAQTQEDALTSTSESMSRVAGVSETLTLSVDLLGTTTDQTTAAVAQMALAQDTMQREMSDLVEAVGDGTSAFNNIVEGLRAISRQVGSLSVSAEETSVSMGQMDRSLVRIRENTSSATNIADSMIAQAAKGAEALQETNSGMADIRDRSSNAARIIRDLSHHVEAIDDVLVVIDEVAHQTGLLSLNAAILAAQAGDDGRGFSVVADEIKALAERTGKSTSEIAHRIFELKSEVQRAVVAIEGGERAVRRGVELTEASMGTFVQLVDAATQTSDMVKSIAKATEEQTRGAQVVSAASQQVAKTVSEVAATAERQVQGAEVVTRSATRLELVARHVETTVAELKGASADITEAVSEIGTLARRLEDAQSAQHSGTSEVLLALESIRSSQIDQLASIDDFDTGD